MTASIATILLPIERCATSIETAFLKAGDSLSRGLNGFEQVGQDLAALRAEFEDGGVGRVSATIRSLAESLRTIAGRLPDNAAVLLLLVSSHQTIGKQLQTLLENVRMMTIIARSARIEAVVFGENVGLASFTDEISVLTQAAQREIATCAGHHDRLADRIRHVAKAQADLDRTFTARLLTLAGDLDEGLSLIEDRGRAGAELLGEVEARSQSLTAAGGMALISLQAGDSTRQRLEHVMTGLQWAEQQAGGDLGRGVLEAMSRLQDAQVCDTVAEFDREARAIDGALSSLIRDAGAMLSGAQATYGGAGRSADTFLAQLTQRLGAAAQMIRTCDQTRREVGEATAELRVMLEELDAAIGRLSEISTDLVMVGVNAGLKAARLGTSGRSLVVIADELKRLAHEISHEAGALIGVFGDVRQTSGRLDLDQADEAAPDAEVAAILAALDRGDKRVAGFLHGLKGAVEGFETDLDKAYRIFRESVALARGLQTTAFELRRLGAGQGGLDEAAAAEAVGTLMLPIYTMAREREIHADVLGGTFEGDAAAPVGADDDIDMLLFG